MQPSESEPDAEAIRLLVVEDEAELRKVFGRHLGLRGFQVYLAASAEEALELSDSLGDTVDLLLTDLTLPGLDGRELVERWRARHPATRVILMSGDTERMRSASGAVPGDHLLEKPFNAKKLIEAVRSALES